MSTTQLWPPALLRDPAVIAPYQADPSVHDRLSARQGIELLRSGECAIAHATKFPTSRFIVDENANQLPPTDIAPRQGARG